MRASLLIAAALALSACGSKDQKDNNQNVDENLTAENIVSNDVTAIDAVTGDAANMAADVDMNFGNLEENGTGNTASEPAKRPAPKKTTSETTAPAANEVANSATNSQ
jgi:hypothetical protein